MENLLVPYQATTHIPCKRVLVLAPHPDDEVFGCGGAIMRHVAQGVLVHVVVVSDGAHGVPADERHNYALQRQGESEEAAKILSYGVPVFWSYRDREVCYGEKLVREILAAINEMQVDLIYAPSIWEAHPDHRALGMAVVEAVRRIGQLIRLALYEIGMPLRPNCLLDISDLAERKLKAMQCFVSQNEKQRYDLDIAALNRYRTYTLPAEVTAAEAYFLVAAEELANDPLKLYQSEYGRQKELGLLSDNREIPLISVIIRSMDRPTLSEALDSVALQTYSNIEVLIINAKGGHHSEISTTCGHFPLRLLNQDGPSLGRSKAGNTGLVAVQGEYFSFLDDDDTLDPDHFSRLVTVRKANDKSALVYASVRCVDRVDPERKIINIFADRYEDGKLLAGNFIPIHAPLVPSILLQRGIRFDESLDVYEDWDFWLHIAQYSRFILSDQVTATYFIAGDSGVNPITVKEEMMHGATIAIYKKWLPRLTPQELWQLSRLYHERNLALHASYHEIELLKLELARVSDHLSNKQAELSNKQAELSNKQAELALVYQSHSWKLTAPLRKLMQWLRTS